MMKSYWVIDGEGKERMNGREQRESHRRRNLRGWEAGNAVLLQVKEKKGK